MRWMLFTSSFRRNEKDFMKRPAFFSFHYHVDAWRASMVRNIGVVENEVPISDNDWEQVKRGGDAAIRRWIDNQMRYKQIVIVLIGRYTAFRPWVLYEIEHAWEVGKPLMGIYIFGLEDMNKQTTVKGDNPFAYVRVPRLNETLERFVPVHEPWRYGTSKDFYNDIRKNLSNWVEDAIAVNRNRKWAFGI